MEFKCYWKCKLQLLIPDHTTLLLWCLLHIYLQPRFFGLGPPISSASLVKHFASRYTTHTLLNVKQTTFQRKKFWKLLLHFSLHLLLFCINHHHTVVVLVYCILTTNLRVMWHKWANVQCKKQLTLRQFIQLVCMFVNI